MGVIKLLKNVWDLLLITNDTVYAPDGFVVLVNCTDVLFIIKNTVKNIMKLKMYLHTLFVCFI